MPRKTPYKVERIPNITVDASVLMEVRLLLLDPTTSRVRFGAMSGLINKLLSDWVKKQKKDSNDADKLRLGGRL
jgi:hypothetical protein